MNDMTINAPLQLVEMHGEPTVRDVDLGARLGFKRADSIRRVIERNRAEVESYGGLRQFDANSGAKGGRPAVEFHLTEEQALCICALSRAPNAPDARRMLIEVFTAYRRGHLVPNVTNQSIGGVVKGVLQKQAPAERAALVEALLGELRPDMIKAFFLTSGQSITVDFQPSNWIVQQQKLEPKVRRGLSTAITKWLQRFCAKNVDRFPAPRLCAKTDRWEFHVDAIQAWMNIGPNGGGGAMQIAETIEKRKMKIGITKQVSLFAIQGGKKDKPGGSTPLQPPA